MLLATDSIAGAAAPPLEAVELAAVAAIMQTDARIHLNAGKSTLVRSRLARRLRERNCAHFRQYVRLVQTDAAERAAMVVALTTNHTHFFRENHHFDHLRCTVRPELEKRARHRPVRLWSAGCSNGEEVLTLAMCLLGETRAEATWLRQGRVKLLATDLAPHVVEATRRAIYSAAAVDRVPAPYRAAWMHRTDDEWRVPEEARSLVTAKVLNLFGPWPMRQKYDVIFCRNVIIYFDDTAKAELEARFVDMLAPGGYLYIGHSERLIGPAANTMRQCGQTTYIKPPSAA